MKKILFLTWDGPTLTYLQGLFIPIFIELKNKGYEFHIIQFTWGKPKNDPDIICQRHGINYTRINIVRKPTLSIGSILTLILNQHKIKRYIKKHAIDILMPRSILPLITALSIQKKTPMLSLAFDADGLSLDERVEFGGWNPKSLLYRLLRDVEYRGVLLSDIVLTRSNEAKKILYNRVGGSINKNKIHLISNGRNTDLFNAQNETKTSQLRKNLNIKPTDFVLIYVGSAGEQYYVPEMLSFLSYCNKKRPTKLICLTGNIDFVKSKLEKKPALKEFVILKSVPFEEVPNYINIADIGLAFRVPSFSMKAVAPVKVGEYLLCGKPVISTSGIGDTELIFKETSCGFLIYEFNNEAFDKLWTEIQESNFNPNDLRNIGLHYFSLKSTVLLYEKALSHLLHNKFPST